RRLFPEHQFVSLDLTTESEQAEKEPESFLREHPGPVIIDEVQYAPGLFRYLKVAVDASRNRHGQFLLTGSQKFTLMKSVSESLAGRADIAELETLSLAEIQAALPKTTPEEAIVRGGFPELHADSDIDHVAFYNSYLATYLEPHEVHCEESKTLSGGRGCAMCVAEHPNGRRSPSGTGSGRGLGNVRLCSIASTGTSHGTGGQLVLLAGPYA